MTTVPLLDTTRAQLDRAVAAAQRDWRAPSVNAAVIRDGALVHSMHVGAAALDPARPATDDTPFMMGSITKTFTAVLVMQLRDAGRLELDDPIGRHLPGIAHGDLTIRRMLGHVSGLQREPAGRMWETLQAPDEALLLEGLQNAEQVLPPHAAFHYSNLAYALLGTLVSEVTQTGWEQAVTDRVLTPLGMTATGLRPGPDRAIGYYVHPFAGAAVEEPLVDLGATAPMGGLWTTLRDLGRYAAFLADPDPAVLAPDTVLEMCRPMVILDPDAWTLGYGLSLGMVRRGERIYVGHGGAMPGFLSGLRVCRADRLAAVVWANSSAAAEPIVLAADLLDMVLAAEPTPVRAWQPEQAQAHLQELLGIWWTEGQQLVFSVSDGALVSEFPGAGRLFASRYAPDGVDRYRVVEGNERGELLEIERDEHGRITRMYRATYAVTRQPLGFTEL